MSQFSDFNLRIKGIVANFNFRTIPKNVDHDVFSTIIETIQGIRGIQGIASIIKEYDGLRTILCSTSSVSEKSKLTWYQTLSIAHFTDDEGTVYNNTDILTDIHSNKVVTKYVRTKNDILTITLELNNEFKGNFIPYYISETQLHLQIKWEYCGDVEYGRGHCVVDLLNHTYSYHDLPLACSSKSKLSRNTMFIGNNNHLYLIIRGDDVSENDVYMLNQDMEWIPILLQLPKEVEIISINSHLMIKDNDIFHLFDLSDYTISTLKNLNLPKLEKYTPNNHVEFLIVGNSGKLFMQMGYNIKLMYIGSQYKDFCRKIYVVDLPINEKSKWIRSNMDPFIIDQQNIMLS